MPDARITNINKYIILIILISIHFKLSILKQELLLDELILQNSIVYSHLNRYFSEFYRDHYVSRFYKALRYQTTSNPFTEIQAGFCIRVVAYQALLPGYEVIPSGRKKHGSRRKTWPGRGQSPWIAVVCTRSRGFRIAPPLLMRPPQQPVTVGPATNLVRDLSRHARIYRRVLYVHATRSLLFIDGRK